MAGLVPAIHDLNTRLEENSWMPGTSPGMTVERDTPKISQPLRRSI
jgi:hypothetical protein